MQLCCCFRQSNEAKRSSGSSHTALMSIATQVGVEEYVRDMLSQRAFALSLESEGLKEHDESPTSLWACSPC
jgi:hypothetical protein